MKAVPFLVAGAVVAHFAGVTPHGVVRSIESVANQPPAAATTTVNVAVLHRRVCAHARAAYVYANGDPAQRALFVRVCGKPF